MFRWAWGQSACCWTRNFSGATARSPCGPRWCPRSGPTRPYRRWSATCGPAGRTSVTCGASSARPGWRARCLYTVPVDRTPLDRLTAVTNLLQNNFFERFWCKSVLHVKLTCAFYSWILSCKFSTTFDFLSELAVKFTLTLSKDWGTEGCCCFRSYLCYGLVFRFFLSVLSVVCVPGALSKQD